MKLVKIKEVPGRRNNDVQGYLTEFMQMNVPVVRVDFAPKEYKSVYSAAGSFVKAIKRLNIPAKPMIRDGQVYLIRTDI